MFIAKGSEPVITRDVIEEDRVCNYIGCLLGRDNKNNYVQMRHVLSCTSFILTIATGHLYGFQKCNQYTPNKEDIAPIHVIISLYKLITNWCFDIQDFDICMYIFISLSTSSLRGRWNTLCANWMNNLPSEDLDLCLTRSSLAVL